MESEKLDDSFDIDDIESFIDGLKNTFDSLDESNFDSSQGFQAKLAKAISVLRRKKLAKIEPLPKTIGQVDIKDYLLEELTILKDHLDEENYPTSRKFDLVMKIAQLRERISNL
ncbi:MAG: hypothetical protein GF383_15650 [Candidatus Lokiarchaeota archaeon]|nr:hypothetical protein [Candidatus Lokiarchaeota archaeon]MBD3343010.1 hypothetical protein [Candidatus Lokiarchaeota archaeon]